MSTTTMKIALHSTAPSAVKGTIGSFRTVHGRTLLGIVHIDAVAGGVTLTMDELDRMEVWHLAAGDQLVARPLGDTVRALDGIAQFASVMGHALEMRPSPAEWREFYKLVRGEWAMPKTMDPPLQSLIEAYDKSLADMHRVFRVVHEGAPSVKPFSTDQQRKQIQR